MLFIIYSIDPSVFNFRDTFGFLVAAYLQELITLAPQFLTYGIHLMLMIFRHSVSSGSGSAAGSVVATNHSSSRRRPTGSLGRLQKKWRSTSDFDTPPLTLYKRITTGTAATPSGNVLKLIFSLDIYSFPESYFFNLFYSRS